MSRWERAFRRLLFCLLGAPLALADGGVFQFIAANPHGPPPNGLLNPALLKGGGAPGSGHKPKKSGKWLNVGIVVAVAALVLLVLACVWLYNN